MIDLYLLFVLSFLDLLIISRVIFGVRISFKWPVTVILLFVVLISFLKPFNIFSVFAAGVILYILLDEVSKKKIKIVLYSYILFLYLDYLVCYFLLLIKSEMYLKSSHQEAMECFIIFVISSVYAIFKGVFNKNNSKRHQLRIETLSRKTIIIVFAIYISFISFIVSGFRFFSTYVNDAKASRVMLWCAFLVCLSMALVIGVFFLILNWNEKMNELYSKEKNRREEQKAYYESIVKTEKETRKYRHDMNGHIEMLKRMTIGDEKLSDYVSKLSAEANRIGGMLYKTDNPVVDAMLSYQLPKCKFGTLIEVSGKLPEELPASDFDVCTIINNLIKNAVEEVNRGRNDGYISVICSTGEEFAHIEIRNSIDRSLKNKPKYTGRDEDNHGFGLINAGEAAERCGCELEHEIKDDEYVAEVLFHMPQI